MVVFKVDNSAFQRSAAKGRSKAERLNALIKEILAYSIHFGCVVVFDWISSADNLLADDLSRDREADFLRHVFETGFWHAETLVLRHM